MRTLNVFLDLLYNGGSINISITHDLKQKNGRDVIITHISMVLPAPATDKISTTVLHWTRETHEFH
jgi:hypothetical protein